MRKTFVLFLVVCCGALGAVVYWQHHRSSLPVSEPVTRRLPSQTPSQPSEGAITPATINQPPNKQLAEKSPSTSVGVPAAVRTESEQIPGAISKSVDALLSANNAAEKHNLFEQLRQSGQLDAVITELKQRMAAHPHDAEIPATLGAAQLNQVRVVKETGGDEDQMGILAMQADQSFNAALKIDPQNWEANFLKAASMYYWPANPERDNEVVQRLSGLIDQQETMTAQPVFAQTYLVLGNQYQKIGQPEKALATWQLGLQKFPNSPELRQKTGGQ